MTFRCRKTPRQDYLPGHGEANREPVGWPAMLALPRRKWPDLTVLWDTLRVYDYSLRQAMRSNDYKRTDRPGPPPPREEGAAGGAGRRAGVTSTPRPHGATAGPAGSSPDERRAPSAGARAACLALLAAATVFAAWLWWDWWVMDAGRAAPWLTAASWSGDILALLACGWAVATGAAWVPPDPALARRVTAGLVLGLAADLLASGATVVADHRGFDRSVAVVGRGRDGRGPGRGCGGGNAGRSG